MKPRLLDLFCGAGGCTKGYQRAGFYVVGVDNRPQPHYCGDEFLQADALEVMRVGALVWEYANGYGGYSIPDDFVAIHASPPCQAYSVANRNNGSANSHPDLIKPSRELLKAAGLPYVIENVPGAPLINPVQICGSGLTTGEMELRRHRLFETNWSLMVPPCAHQRKLSIGVYGNGTPAWHREKLGRNVLADEWREVMGTPWMTKAEMSQAIPPSYTELIGHQLMQHVQVAVS